jgi:hypothetical protein
MTREWRSLIGFILLSTIVVGAFTYVTVLAMTAVFGGP